MPDDKHLIQPPNRLSGKVRKSGGPSPEKAILRALNAAEDLMDGYQGWAVDDLTRLWKAYEASQRTRQSAPQIREMFEIAHGVRGEGGSFGFPVVSVIADSLCKFIETKSRLSRGELEVIKVHIMAMRAVFRQGLKGPQPGLERELKQLLALLRDRMGGGH